MCSINPQYITVFTPTYNRKHLLPKLYESLRQQTDSDFEWIVVDDGSTDGTDEWFKKNVLEADVPFSVHYLLQSNGGKHRAINKGVKLANGKWFFIMDSDDWLTPDAVAIMKRRLTEIEYDLNFCGITALRVTPDFQTIGTNVAYNTLDTDFFSYRFKYHIKGDRAEIVRTSIMKEFPFPEFSGENFLAEGVIWYSISNKYLSRFTCDKFYICEYQKGGLTDTFIKRMDENPLGAMSNHLSILNHPNCPLSLRIIVYQQYKRAKKIAQQATPVIPPELKDLHYSVWYAKIISPIVPILLIINRVFHKFKDTFGKMNNKKEIN